MELLSNLCDFLFTQNEQLTSIIIMPLFLIENTLFLYLILSIFKLELNNKSKILYVIISAMIGIITNFFIPSPINIPLNYILVTILIYKIFSTTITKSLVLLIVPTTIYTLLSNLISNPFMKVLNISSDVLLYTPFYRILYLIVVYIFVVILIFIIKTINYNSSVKNLPIKTNKIILGNVMAGFLAIITQLFINYLYIDTLPLAVTLFVFIILLAYFSISLFSLNKLLKLAYTTQQLENAEKYNKTLNILYDNVRGFKHDFDNIVTAIGGYVKTDDMDGLKKYYLQLEDDCQKVNNLYVLNPELINNPGVYSLLTDKYHEAEKYDIKITMSLLLDFNTLNMKIYEFIRILGILLDNAIDASKECTEKCINIIFRDDYQNHRQLAIIENTYNDKNVDTESIFCKGFSNKKNHTGLGLWEVKNILKKNKNLSLYTHKGEKYFSQQLEIYYKANKKD